MKHKYLQAFLLVSSIGIISFMNQGESVEASIPTDGEPYNEFWENYQWDVLNTWIQEENGKWWYHNPVDGYTTNGWQRINAKWHYFDEEGWMKTGWQQDNGIWYYLKSDGEMATGWVSDGNAWYYLSESGALISNSWLQEDSLWYYLKDDGAMAEAEWINSYYLGENGAWLPDTRVEDGTWVSEYEGLSWRYRFADGSYAHGWIQLDDGWYYFDENGYMAYDQWVGNYFVSRNGKMLTNDWILSFSTAPFNRLYYVGNDGKWIPDEVYHGAYGIWKKDSNGWWFQRADGSYPAGEFECVKDKWYFFDTKGYRYTGLMEDIENGGYYYFYEDGSMAVDTTIDGRYFNANGCAE